MERSNATESDDEMKGWQSGSRGSGKSGLTQQWRDGRGRGGRQKMKVSVVVVCVCGGRMVGGGPPLQSTTSRTNQELVDATSDALPFQRRGSARLFLRRRGFYGNLTR